MAAIEIRCCSFEHILSSYPFPLPGFLAASADPLDLTPCSITENKASSQTERLAGSTEVGARTGEECHLCHGDLFPTLTL